MVDLVVLQIRGRVAVVGKAIGGGFTGRYDDRHFHGMVTRVELYQYVQDSDPCSRWVFLDSRTIVDCEYTDLWRDFWILVIVCRCKFRMYYKWKTRKR